MKSTSGRWAPWVAVVLAAFAIAGAGCGGNRARRDARLQERQARNLLRQASRDTGCAEGTLSPQQIADNPPVYTVTGCTVPIEYWLECRGRGGRNCDWRPVPLLNQQAAMPLQCPPQAIQQQPGQAPNTRFASGCGQMAPFAIACNGAACGWTQTGPTQGQQVAMVAGPGQPGGSPAASALETQVQMQREAILSCVDTGQITLSLRWSAQGEVVVALPQNLTGSPAEACIHAVLGAIRVQAGQPGEITVPVQ
jgi:hypothetical protein